MVATRTLNATTTKEDVELGGKQVLKVTTTIAPFPFYVYTTGDVSFTVAGGGRDDRRRGIVEAAVGRAAGREDRGE